MTEKSFSVRFSAAGGDRIVAELQGIGRAGSTSLHEIDQSALQLEAGLARMAQESARTQTVMRGIGDVRVPLAAVTTEQVKSARASADAFTETQRLRASYDSLRGSLDPVHAATMRLEHAEEELTEAVRRGVITRAEANQTLTMVRSQYRSAAEGAMAAANGVDRFGRSAGNRQHMVRQFALQLNQVGQQGAVTGNYLQAMAIQLPDMMLGFGTLGIAIGAVAAVMGPMIVDWIRGSRAGNQLGDTVQALATSLGELDSATSAANTPLEDLLQNYGSFVGRAQEVLEVQRQLAYLDSTQALTSVTEGITDLFGRLEMLGDTSISADFLQPIVEQFGQLNPDAVNELSRSLGISLDQAILLTNQFVELREARGPEEQADALRNVIEQFEIATGGAFEMSDGAREVYRQLLTAEAAALRLAAIDLASNTGAAADEAERLGQAYLDALSARNALNAGFDTSEGGAVTGGRGRAPTQAEIDTMRLGINFGPPPARSSSSGGGQTEAEREHQRMLREAEQLYASTRTELENYNETQERYQELLQSGAITQDTFNRAMVELNQEFINSSDSPLVQGIDGVSDALARAAVYGDNLGEMMREVLQGIYFDILNSGIRDALLSTFNVGPGGGGGRKLFASLFSSLFGGGSPVKSYAGGGYTGSGSRTGGLDGRGGTLALLHPNETVIDHTKGQGTGVTVVNRVVFEDHVGVQKEERQERQSDGSTLTRVIIRAVNQGLSEGSLDRGMRHRFGVGPQGAQR